MAAHLQPISDKSDMAHDWCFACRFYGDILNAP
jgi:hypothetical protein